jgi:hypothetical protein
MRARFRLALVMLMLALMLCLLPSSFGWGENAERLIASEAVSTLPEEMQPFFEANRQFIVQHVSETGQSPDKTAAGDHNDFIELDHYGQFPFSALPRNYTAAVAKYSRRTIETYGQLPWEIGLYSKKLTDAFQSGNWSDAKLSAAILAHYVAAAHDPFNAAMNRDGSLSGQTGINERFGTRLVDRYQLFFFVKPNEAALVRDPTDYAFEMCLSAHSWLEPVLLEDRRAREDITNYTDEYYDRFYARAGAILIRQLSDASTDTGSYWMTAWINAGRPQLPPR